jgi:beta-N-acetylhexosaminidase
MIKKSLIVCSLFSSLVYGDISLDKKIGQMFMVGFFGTSAPQNSKICQDIRDYNLGGVILFDYNPIDKTKPKNIYSKNQVAKLTKELQACSPNHDLLIAVDQEGGKVQRLKSKYGFYGKFPKASDAIKMPREKMLDIYTSMAKELKSVGINYDLAPVVDLDINPNNYVIHKLGRSFGKSPSVVSMYASEFISAMHRYGVLTSLKHFPGHGSSLGDTHKGFVDVTNLWSEVELEPYKKLKDRADTVMVAHVFNRHLDSKYPATLSANVVNGLLRDKIGFDGVVITDDLQMGAIKSKYSLSKTISLAINAGDDILLFGNQLTPKKTVSIKTLIAVTKKLIKDGKIQKSTIDKSYDRIQKLKAKL